MHVDPDRVRRAFTPVARPELVRDLYSPDEVGRLFGVLRDHGPWSLIAAQTFASAEEFLAVAGGGGARGDVSLADLITPTFRGYFAQQAVCLYDEVQEVFYSTKLLERVKEMFGARYGLPAQFFFNLRAPARSLDAGHFDPQVWRGMDMVKVPVWFSTVMAKSGLFDRWEVRTGQVITYFYRSPEDGGFTYWPDGPAQPPARFPAPFWNDAVVVHNPRMYHRGEASGPVALRANPTGMSLETVIAADGEDWVLRNGDEVIARHDASAMRFLFHYGARVFDDLDEVRAYYDHTDDLTMDRALGLIVDDLRGHGLDLEVPDDPFDDPAFVRTLADAYAVSPTSYPAEAPVDAVPA
ncbi:hypothetical protein [Nocardioides sp. YIM 152315]|uniref:hypothetical protein n=1 Tax=Nocardioides sp. YIM 152315 TaxID=3031760 RepID=UPI0023DB9FA2|nr:hypothetical protein [Nocardioides sp. YIM 152315]MDF1604652.1 hypothetical protein [Nocardioides sp. YIM 152315]